MAAVAQTIHWTTCIDFGTAASKASVCAPPRLGASPADLVHPLRIGSICGEPNPYVAQSALLFDRGRIYFGWNALQRAGEADVEADILHSFKTFLAAADLKEALRLRLKRTIDRSGAFCQRDALILYVAYLLHLSERAALDDRGLPPEARRCLRRYAYPTWRAGHAANTIVGAIFDAAAAVASTFGDRLSSSDGIDQSDARRSLDAAATNPGEGRIEAGVFEAQAAAECHVAYSQGLPDHILVFDMGAGTTDVTAFERGGTDGAPVMRELANARQSVMLGCDEIDKILVRYIFDQVKLDGANAKKSWRRLMLRSRRLKEDLFQSGVIDTVVGGRKVRVRLGEFSRDRQLVAFIASLSHLFRTSLNQIGMRAVAAGKDEIGVVLAGGGSTLPFIQKMAARTRPSVARIRNVRVQPIVPDWAKDPAFNDQLAPIFPQVAISIGGAVANLQPTDLHF